MNKQENITEIKPNKELNIEIKGKDKESKDD